MFRSSLCELTSCFVRGWCTPFAATVVGSRSRDSCCCFRTHSHLESDVLTCLRLGLLLRRPVSEAPKSLRHCFACQAWPILLLQAA